MANISDDEMPENIFIPTEVTHKIIPSQKVYFKIWEYFNEKHHKDTLDKEELSSYLKHRYSRHNKDIFTKILDKYSALNIQMANLMFRMNLSNGKNVLIYVRIPEDANNAQDCKIFGIHFVE